MPIHVIGGVSQRPGPPACDPGCMFILYLNLRDAWDLYSVVCTVYSTLYVLYANRGARPDAEHLHVFIYTLDFLLFRQKSRLAPLLPF